MEAPLTSFNNPYTTSLGNNQETFNLQNFNTILTLLCSDLVCSFTFLLHSELCSCDQTCLVCGSCWEMRAPLSELFRQAGLRLWCQPCCLDLTPAHRITCWTKLRLSKLARGTTRCYPYITLPSNRFTLIKWLLKTSALDFFQGYRSEGGQI